MEYRIIVGDTPSSLEFEVAQLIINGWVPQGGLCIITNNQTNVVDYQFAQAMVKFTSTPPLQTLLENL